MIKHINFESDCRRIAKEIQEQANDPTSDAVCLGSVEAIVSQELIHSFFTEKGKHVKEWEKEINKHLKACSIKYKTHGYGHGWFIVFDIEYDDVDGETEEW